MATTDATLAAGGEMAARLRSIDWATTPLGPEEAWPATLKNLVGVILASRFPLMIWWGPELIQIYNDAWLPLLGDKHPATLGSPAAEAWAEVWPIVGSPASEVLAGGAATCNHGLLLPICRRGFIEESYFTWSVGPIADDAGAVGGLLIAAQETTEEVQSERQLRTLRQLASCSATATTAVEACEAAARVLGESDADAPFSLLYLIDADGSSATLASSAGLGDYQGPGRAARVALRTEGTAQELWPLAAVARSGQPQVVTDLIERAGELPGGRWRSPPRLAICLPLAGAGFLVCGVSPRRALDSGYTEFFRQVADSIARGIASTQGGKLQLMADHAPVVICMTEPDGTCTFLSEPWHELTGQTSEAGLGFGWLEMVHPEDRGRASAVYADSAARREPFRVEYRIRCRDGAYRWVIDAGTPLIGADGVFRGYIGSLFDITERKSAEEALEEADRRKNEFLAMLAHELRNPIFPLQTALRLVRMRMSSPAADHYLDIAERQAGNLGRIVDDLLEVSRVTEGKIELRKEVVDLSQAVSRALDAAREFIESRRHEVSVSAPARPVRVLGDPVRLDQIITNLLTNAAKYTDPGGRIAVCIERSGSTAELRVRDTGMGISESLRPRLFELFHQGEGGDLSRGQGGLGVGLTIVSKLVELHGGAVEVRSEGPGKGSEFIVRLPELLAEPAPPPEGSERAARAAGRRVLVVDDNRDAAETLADLVGALGHEVRFALDGPSALEICEDWLPDVVFLDIGLPAMDGYEVARELRRRRGEHPVLVALTGYGQESDRDRSRAAGFASHLVKPPRFETIAAMLETEAGAAFGA